MANRDMEADVKLMRQCLKLKAEQHPDLKARLLATATNWAPRTAQRGKRATHYLGDGSTRRPIDRQQPPAVQRAGASTNIKRGLDQHIRDLIIGTTRNWSCDVLEWNLAADSNYQPHTDRGGCDSCQGAVTIDGNKVTRNAAYYIMPHAAKYIRPGSVRIASNYVEARPNVALETTDGKKDLVVLNHRQSPQIFNIRYQGKQTAAALNSGAVGTYFGSAPAFMYYCSQWLNSSERLSPPASQYLGAQPKEAYPRLFPRWFWIPYGYSSISLICAALG